MAREPAPIPAELVRMAASQQRALRLSASLSTLAEALWLPQAALLAWALAGLATGRVVALSWCAGGVAAIGILRAVSGLWAAGRAEAAADAVIADTRSALLCRADRRAPEAAAPSSAATAALLVDKIEMLRPYLLRWHPVRARVAVMPLLILSVSTGLSWAAGLILAISGPVIPMFMALIGLAARDAAKRQMDEISDLNALMLDRIGALVDIRLLGARRAMLADFTLRADRLRARTMAVLRVAFLSGAVLELFAALGVAMMAVFVGFTLLGALDFGTWGRDLGLAEAIFLLLMAPAYFQPLRDMAAAWHDRIAAQAVARDLLADAAVPVPAILGAGHAGRALAGTVTTHGLVLRGHALPDLIIAPGEGVALTGPSGAGKSALLLAIAGLLPAYGALRIDGVPLGQSNADDWRAALALIPQKPHFRDVSLREELTSGRPATPGAIADALRLADAQGIVARLPDGLETRLGESGAGVSGGEARRLTIARAALRRPALILADEPTADLDDGTAEAVIAGLLEMHRKGATLVAASHDARLIKALPRRIEVGR